MSELNLYMVHNRKECRMAILQASEDLKELADDIANQIDGKCVGNILITIEINPASVVTINTNISHNVGFSGINKK